MVFENAETESQAGTPNSRKIPHGPYRATKLWNGIVRKFSDEMQCKKHRRHLKMYSSCFSGSEATDFLHEILKRNPNIGNDVERRQTIQLLRKFLKNHVIEDVQGRWGSENFDDDGRLYRFPATVNEDRPQRKPLAVINENVQCNNQEKGQKKNKRKMKGESDCGNNGCVPLGKKPNTENEENWHPKSSKTSSIEYPKRQLPSLSAIPKCRAISLRITDADIQNIWKTVVLSKVKEALRLQSLDDVIMDNEIKGDDIRHNATCVGKSGVVQVAKADDIPYWALSAMTCLANWPDSTDNGLPCYPGFEKDVFKAVCDYFHGIEPTSMLNYGALKRKTQENITKPLQPNEMPEPLLTYKHYELFTHAICLIQPRLENEAIAALKYALLLLPPANRRKLHLLMRLMSKMCRNRHLEKLGGKSDIRTIVLQTFSKIIMSCSEEVYLDELLAIRLVSFLIDHHSEVLKVPEDVEKLVEERLSEMRRPETEDDDACEEIPQMQYVLAANHGTKVRLRHKPRITQNDRHKRKSSDLMRSWDKLVTTFKRPVSHAPSSTSEGGSSAFENDTYLRMRLRSRKAREVLESPHPVRRVRTRTVGDRCELLESQIGASTRHLDSRLEPIISEARGSMIKSAKSCPDICDIKPQAKLTGKPSDMGSLWNLKMLGKPFSRLRKAKS